MQANSGNSICTRGDVMMSNVIDNIRFNFLYIDTYSFGKNWIFPESIIPYSMFRYIEEGEGTFFIDDEEFKVQRDQIIYIPRGSSLSCYALTDNFSFTSIRFTNSVFFEGGDFLTDYYGMKRIMDGKGKKIYFEKIYEWVKQDAPARMFFVRGNLELLIGILISDGEKLVDVKSLDSGKREYDLEKIRRRIRIVDSKMDSRIQLVVDYILLHPAENYTPQKMAEMAELSKQRFSTLFKQQMGKSPMAYIRELKLTTAARKLLMSNVQISEIAYEVGYEDPNYFIREFKAAFGYTPRQYRRAAKE